MEKWSDLLHPNKIVVNRDSRQRRELTGIEELAASIKRRGQLQPIVVTRGTLELVAGERRLTAIRHLAATDKERHYHVKVVYSDEVDPAELQALELEENIKRIDLPWKDNCLAIEAYHKLQIARDPKWTASRTAEELGIDAGEISKRLAVAKELKTGNSLVAQAPKLSIAKGIVQRQTERREAAEVSQLTSLITVPETVVSGAERPSAGTGYILNENFHDWASSYTGPKFNLIHCDFPYGVGMHKSEQSSGDAHGVYEDTSEIYWQLVDTLLNHLDRFADDSAHLVFWFSMDYYQLTLEKLSTRFQVNPFPLIWFKSDGLGIIPDANRGPRRIYETAFLASRGDRKIVRPVANAIDSPLQKGRHMSEKPQRVLLHFFRMLVDETSSVLDPTCGSGSAIRAASTSNAGRFLGLELNTEFAKHADEVLAQHLNGDDQVDIEQLIGASNDESPEGVPLEVGEAVSDGASSSG